MQRFTNTQNGAQVQAALSAAVCYRALNLEFMQPTYSMSERSSDRLGWSNGNESKAGQIGQGTTTKPNATNSSNHLLS